MQRNTDLPVRQQLTKSHTQFSYRLAGRWHPTCSFKGDTSKCSMARRLPACLTFDARRFRLRCAASGSASAAADPTSATAAAAAPPGGAAPAAASLAATPSNSLSRKTSTLAAVPALTPAASPKAAPSCPAGSLTDNCWTAGSATAASSGCAAAGLLACTRKTGASPGRMWLSGVSCAAWAPCSCVVGTVVATDAQLL